MLNRPDKLDVDGLMNYLKTLVKEHVENPDKIEIRNEEYGHTILYHLSVHEEDIAGLEKYQMTMKSLNHIMNKVTQANIGKNGQLNNQLDITP